MDSPRTVRDLHQTFKSVLEACPELVYIGNPVLRAPTEEVSYEDGLIVAKRLIEVLKRYRTATGMGRGMAAPQIGENKAVFVTYVDDQFRSYINPKITQRSKTNNLYMESCISCGFLTADIKRPESIFIEYTDENADIRAERVDGFMARLLQHEFDHLEGKVNIDIAEPNTIHFMIDDPLKQTLRKA